MTATQLISVVQPCLIATSVWLAGQRERPARVAVGWLLGLVVQALFAVYAVLSGDLGWALGLLVVAPFFARNWLRARRVARAEAAARDAPPPNLRRVAVELGDGLVAVPLAEWRRLTTTTVPAERADRDQSP